MVRHYNHDASNCISRITTECSIIAVLSISSPGNIFTDRNSTKTATVGRRSQDADLGDHNSREYFWPKTPTRSTRSAGNPTTPRPGQDDRGYAAYLEKHLQPVLPLFERLKQLEEEDAIRTDSKAARLPNRAIRSHSASASWKSCSP